MFPLIILAGLGYFVVRAVTESPHASTSTTPSTTPTTEPPKQLPTSTAMPQSAIDALAQENDPAKLEALAKSLEATSPAAATALRQKVAVIKAAKPATPTGVPGAIPMPTSWTMPTGIPGLPGLAGQQSYGLMDPVNAAGVPVTLEQAMIYESNPVALEELAKMYDAVDPKAAATLRQKILALQGGYPGLLNADMLPVNTPFEVVTALTYEMNPDTLEAMAAKYMAGGRQDLATALYQKAAILRSPWMQSGGKQQGLASDPGYIEEALPWPGFPNPPGTEPPIVSQTKAGGGTMIMDAPSVQGYGYGPYNPGVRGVAGDRPMWLPANVSWPPTSFDPAYPWVG